MKNILIVNALIWAAVILIAGWLYHESTDYLYLLGSLCVGFTLQNGFTYQVLKKRRKIK